MLASRPRGGSASSVDSLFDDLGAENAIGDSDDGLATPAPAAPVASRAAPPIPGLYVFPSLLDAGTACACVAGFGMTDTAELAAAALAAIAEADHFAGGTRDQVMLFTSAGAPSSPTSPTSPTAPTAPPSSLPAHIAGLLSAVASTLAPLLPPPVYALAFDQPLARQAILNLYPPGAGIAPHVDLPGRYADGIVGVSLTGACVMTFTRGVAGKEGQEGRAGRERHDVWVPPRTVYVMTGESRWAWAHGIEGREADQVDTGQREGGREERAETVMRGLRVSATFRWMKEGADVLA